MSLNHVGRTTSTIEALDVSGSPTCPAVNDVVEQSIEIMQNSAGLCVHPLHYHSFQSQNGIQTMLSNSSLSLRRLYDRTNAIGAHNNIARNNNNNICILCCEEFSTLSSRIVPQMFQRTTTASKSQKSNEPILKCLACHALAHRSCATSILPVSPYPQSFADKKDCYEASQQCTVNRRKILELSGATAYNNGEGNASITTNINDIDTPNPSNLCKSNNTAENITRQPRRKSDYPANQVVDALAVDSDIETTSDIINPATDQQSVDDTETSQKNLGYRPSNKLFLSVQQNVSLTTVAGGIAGGLAGLVLLGPVGAVYACCAGAGGVNAFMGTDSTAERSTTAPEIQSGDGDDKVVPMDSSCKKNDSIETPTSQPQNMTDASKNIISQPPDVLSPNVVTATADSATRNMPQLEVTVALSPDSFTAYGESIAAKGFIGDIEDSSASLLPSTSTPNDDSTTVITIETTAPQTSNSAAAAAAAATTESSATTAASTGTMERKTEQHNLEIMETPQKEGGHLKAKKLLNSVKKNVSMTAVAGGIAGGLAGMALIGPAGAVYACYLGAGGLNVLLGLEGAATLSLVAAGIATGTITGNKIHDHIDETKQRIITMSDPYRRTVLLVRPNIVIDPIWDQICLDAVKSAPKSAYNRQQRRQNNQPKDADIIGTNEDEIDTNDKILLLVSRILNDRTSLPGYVLRFLIESYKDRCRNRTILCATNQSIVAPNPRVRRDDAHAIIKHVTATVLNVRPELGSSARCTELTASAVESIVFGQIYDSVLEEIITETLSYDTELWRRITVLLNDHPDLLEVQCREPESKDHKSLSIQSTCPMPLVCTCAMDTLKMVHEARSVADKLHFCVKFIDAISSHYTKVNTENVGDENTNNNFLCADTLIQMVCQHIILVENYGNLYAQVRFLEEFASDEQLVHGYDGYALVTIQAALHVLQQPLQEGSNAEDWYNDVFG